MNTPSLRGRARQLLIGTGVVAVTSLLALGTSEFTAARAEVEGELEVASAVANSRVGQIFEQNRTMVRALAESPYLAGDEPSCRSFLAQTNRLFADERAIFAIGVDGRTWCHSVLTPGETGPPATTRPWWPAAVSGESFTTTGPMFGAFSERWVIVHTAPVMRDGRQIAVVGMSIGAEAYEDLFPSEGLPEKLALMVTTADGVVVTSRNAPQQVGDTVREAHAMTPEGVVDVEEDDGGAIWRMTRASQSPWIVHARLPLSYRNEIFLANATPRLAILLALFVLLIGMVAAFTRTLDGALSRLLRRILRSDDDRPPETVPGEPEEIRTVRRAFETVLDGREEALDSERSTRLRLQSILNNAVLGIVVEEGGRITEANPALAEMLGYDDPADLVGLDTRDLYADADEYEVIRAIAREGEVTTAEARWVRQHGRPFPVRLRWSLSRTANGELWEGIVEDLGERRRLEEQLRQAQKMEAVGRLAGGVAHDFNNFLTVIGGQAELLAEELEDPDLTPVVEDILDSVGRSARLTHQLLAFSRRQVSRPVAFDLASSLARTVELVERLIGEDIELRYAPSGEPLSIVADAGQIEQAIMNLCTNARDAMPEGGALTIRTLTGGLDDSMVGIVVSDTGVGMSDDVVEQIFEPFFTTKPTGKGTGLGLSQVYGIVTQNGGRVEVDTEAGRGTTFTLWLPRAEGRHPGAPRRRSSTGAAEVEGRGESILVVEDDDKVREVIVRTLRRAGYRVEVASCGRSGLEAALASAEGWDLILTDVRMPGMSGPEMVEELARRGRAKRALFISGYADRTPSVDLPIEWDFIPKPFTSAALRDAVRTFLDGRTSSPRRAADPGTAGRPTVEPDRSRSRNTSQV